MGIQNISVLFSYPVEDEVLPPIHLDVIAPLITEPL